MDTEKKPCIILAGPTAVGKTKASILLAKAIDGEIISADSMQVYRYMDIGSAKIMPWEMQGIRPYLIDELLPEDEFNVVKFQALAQKYMSEIYAKGKIPIMVGGTGFYIQSVLYNIDFTENMEHPCIRKHLQQLVDEHGKEALHQKLVEVDEPSARFIHPNNTKRVIRALEFYELTGQRISEHNEQQRQNNPFYHTVYFVLNDERKVLYERINHRIDAMIEKGLVEEVKSLKERGYTKDLVSMQGLGYKEILEYLEGTMDLEKAIYILKRDTRHFAKRQLTWFKREKDVYWINKPDFGYDEDKIVEKMLTIIKEQKII